jgi:hypothetical protein
MRRLLNDKKGQIHVIEAFFATVLLFSCLMLIPAPSTEPKSTTVNLSSMAQNVLLSLDSNGYLANAVDIGDWGAVKSSVESALPLTVWFNLTVYNQNNVCLNPYPISNAGAVSDKIVSLDYVCVSQNGNYQIYILRLQLSMVD